MSPVYPGHGPQPQLCHKLWPPRGFALACSHTFWINFLACGKPQLSLQLNSTVSPYKTTIFSSFKQLYFQGPALVALEQLKQPS